MRPILVALVSLMYGAAFAQDAPGQAIAEPQPSPAGQARFEALVARIQDFQQRHMKTIHGADNPAAVPRGTVVRTFFARFPEGNDGSFAQIALEQVGASGADVETLKQAQRIERAEASLDACSLLLEGSLSEADGLDIANYIIAAEAERDREISADYQSVIDRLSPRVRSNVLLGIDEIARGLVGTNLDHLGMAQEDPELYKVMTTGYCRGKSDAMAKRIESASGQSGSTLNSAR